MVDGLPLKEGFVYDRLRQGVLVVSNGAKYLVVELRQAKGARVAVFSLLEMSLKAIEVDL